MKLTRSSLGIRFINMTTSDDDIHKVLFEEIFSVLTVTDLRGIQIYAGAPEDEPQTYYIVLTNGKFKRMRRIYKKLATDTGLSIYLLPYRPFVDHNRMTHITGLDYYGKVKRDGYLAGGERGIFGLAVPKKHGKKRPVGKGIRILLAPDSFKGSLSSMQILRLLTTAARRYFPGAKIMPVAVADGGEGTLDAIMARGGEYHSATVSDPLGRRITAQYGVLEGRTAVIEAAQAIGLPLLTPDERNPFLTSSFGVGEMIKRALDEGLRDIILAIGGTATNDGGMGCARALGMRFFDADGNELAGNGADLIKVERIDTSNLNPALNDMVFTLICDVSNPMTGENGAAMVYAPQKGAQGRQIFELERGMISFARVLNNTFGCRIENVNGAGAAGGLGAMMIAAFGAELKSGIDTILDAAEFDSMLEDASLIVTGEGRLDNQTILGHKAVHGVIERARKYGVPSVIIAGDATQDAIAEFSDVAITTLVSANNSLEECMNDPERVFFETAENMFKFIRTGRDMVK